MTVVITDTDCKTGPALACPALIENVSSFTFKENNVVEIQGDQLITVEYAASTTVAFDVATQTLTLS